MGAGEGEEGEGGRQKGKEAEEDRGTESVVPLRSPMLKDDRGHAPRGGGAGMVSICAQLLQKRLGKAGRGREERG